MKETNKMRRGLVALLMLVAAVGLALPAAIAGNGNGKTPPGQAKQQSPAVTTATPATAPSPANHQTQGTAGTSGNPTQPQPLSNADQNKGGANGQCPGGPYCSTRNGSPSQNGNGGGKATGKPCAGCVGKADNKNPKGQMPNGSDHNSGYECDKNNGVGKGNPAHTGCSQSPPPCTANCTPPCKSNCSPPPPCKSNCTPAPPCKSNCTPTPPCQSNCTPTPPCKSNCSPPSCSSNCAPSSTPPGKPVTVTCPKGGGTIMVTGPSGSYTVVCQSGQKTVTPHQPGLIKVITKTHTVVQRVGVTAPSGSQLTG